MAFGLARSRFPISLPFSCPCWGWFYIFIYLEEFGNVTFLGDRGVDIIENIRVVEFSDISRVGDLKDCLVEK